MKSITQIGFAKIFQPALNLFANPVTCEMQTLTLQKRSFINLGPFTTDVKLIICQIGATEKGEVHPLCAPTLFVADNSSHDGLEIISVPQDVILKRDIMYTLCAFVQEIRYRHCPI